MKSVTVLVAGFVSLCHCCRRAVLLKTECWFCLYLPPALLQAQYLSRRSRIKICIVPSFEQSFGTFWLSLTYSCISKRGLDFSGRNSQGIDTGGVLRRVSDVVPPSGLDAHSWRYDLPSREQLQANRTALPFFGWVTRLSWADSKASSYYSKSATFFLHIYHLVSVFKELWHICLSEWPARHSLRRPLRTTDQCLKYLMREGKIS